ncbi:MAG: sulfite exporter TauE/SafE family protein [Mariniphaga sp.]|nr:sulfite exporter TauE/SafE family protein [Mariniphaga sp.]
MIPVELIPLLLIIVAFLYSSVGHGGASGYLALMALAGIAPSVMKPTALILNLFVAGTAFVAYYKAGYFRWRLLWPFALTSMPAAYFGAKISLNPVTYKIILGICLLFAVGRMLYKPKKNEESLRQVSLPIAGFTGIILGFISGIIGIGGGIILSPLLILTRWAGMKEAATASAGFILLNSLSGLIALYSKGFLPDENIAKWILAAFFGGILGSYTGSFKLSVSGLRYVLSGVLFLAAFKLIF